MFILSIIAIAGLIVYFFKSGEASYLKMAFQLVLLLVVINTFLPAIFGFFTTTEKGTVSSIQEGIASVEIEYDDKYQYLKADISDYPRIHEGDEVTLKVTNAGLLQKASLQLDSFTTGTTPQLQTAEIKSHNINIFAKIYRFFTE